MDFFICMNKTNFDELSISSVWHVWQIFLIKFSYVFNEHVKHNYSMKVYLPDLDLPYL